MTYTPQIWTNGQGGNTPLSAARLTVMENGIAANQPFDADLTAIAALVSAADQLLYATGTGTWALTGLTAFIRTLLDDVDAAAARATLGLGTAATTAATAYDTTGAATAAQTFAVQRSNHIGTQVAATISDFAAVADVRVAAGITGKQPLDAELTALAGLASAADRLPYFTGSGAASLATFTAFARTLLDDIDAAAVRTTLGLGTAATTAATAYEAAGSVAAASTADRARANHTGTQLASTISDFTTAADARVTAANAANRARANHTGSQTASTISDFNAAVDTQVTTGTGWTTAPVSTFAKTLLDDASAAAMRTTLGMGAAAAVANTTGATLAALETEVNKLKALLRTAGLLTP